MLNAGADKAMTQVKARSIDNIDTKGLIKIRIHRILNEAHEICK